MARRGINTPSEKSDVYFNGRPEFNPRKIAGAKRKGINSKPPEVTVAVLQTSLRDATALKADYEALDKRFDKTLSLLDAAGQNMTVCTNLPTSIRERFLRHKRETESCWAFYKRMVDLAFEFPDFDPYNPDSFAQIQSDNGNDVIEDLGENNDADSTEPEADPNDPWSQYAPYIPPATATPTPYAGEQRPNDFNENPGKAVLLVMLFLAILKFIVNAIAVVSFAPQKTTTKRTNDLQKEKKDDTGVGGLGAISPVAGVAAKAASAIMSAAKKIAISIFFNKALNAGMNWATQKLAGGPKMKRDVERFDSVMLSNYMCDKAYESEDSEWPDAAVLYRHFSAMKKRQSHAKGSLKYFAENAFYTAQAADKFGNAVATEALKVPEDMLSVLTLQKDFTGSALDRMDRLLQGEFVDNLFCCMLRYLGANSEKDLKAMRLILKIALNGKTLLVRNVDASLNNLWMSIQSLILSKIASILSNVYNNINDGIGKQLRVAASTKLAGCLSWNVFVNKLLQYLKDIELQLLELIVEWNNSLRFQNEYQQVHIGVLTDSKYIRRLLKLIEILIRARQNGEMCKDTLLPTDGELRAIARRAEDAFGIPEDAFGIPDDGGGGTTPTGDDNQTPQGASGDRKRDKFDDCLKRVPKEDMERISAWINALGEKR
jgi:hypothetical protein